MNRARAGGYSLTKYLSKETISPRIKKNRSILFFFLPRIMLMLMYYIYWYDWPTMLHERYGEVVNSQCSVVSFLLIYVIKAPFQIRFCR